MTIFEKMIEYLLIEFPGSSEHERARFAGRVCPSFLQAGKDIQMKTANIIDGKKQGCRGITCLECRMKQYEEVEE